jgi:NadR type nicotinamide-nucleotide adenylyltransferase
MIRVVVTGSECTGKTTLARELAQHYGTVWVPEFARRFVEEKGAAPEYADVEAIARGQIMLEERMRSESGGLLIQDTDLLSTVVYGQHYYGDCPKWIEAALLKRAGDLYLLADIDVPWSPEGDQRDRGDRREDMHELFRSALGHRGFRFVEISGTLPERLEKAIATIDELATH